jgi:hypothetical protein
MKKAILISLISLVVFTIISLSTAKWETVVDGNDSVGYPMTFYTKFSGMCFDCPPEPYKINYLKLTVDLLFAGFIGFATYSGIEKIKNRTNDKKNAL